MSAAQLVIDFAAPLVRARAERDIVMHRVSEKAEREDDPGFAARAYAFLVAYAAEHALINPEDVTREAAEEGIAPTTDDRAWGGIWKSAAKNKLIERSTVTYQRTRGHSSVGVLWRSLVCA